MEDILRDNYPYIVARLTDISNIIAALYSYRILSSEDKSRIYGLPTEEGRARDILDIVIKKKDSHDKFLELLKTENAHIYNHLQNCLKTSVKSSMEPASSSDKNSTSDKAASKTDADDEKKSPESPLLSNTVAPTITSNEGSNRPSACKRRTLMVLGIVVILSILALICYYFVFHTKIDGGFENEEELTTLSSTENFHDYPQIGVFFEKEFGTGKKKEQNETKSIGPASNFHSTTSRPKNIPISNNATLLIIQYLHNGNLNEAVKISESFFKRCLNLSNEGVVEINKLFITQYNYGICLWKAKRFNESRSIFFDLHRKMETRQTISSTPIITLKLIHEMSYNLRIHEVGFWVTLVNFYLDNQYHQKENFDESTKGFELVINDCQSISRIPVDFNFLVYISRISVSLNLNCVEFIYDTNMISNIEKNSLSKSLTLNNVMFSSKSNILIQKFSFSQLTFLNNLQNITVVDSNCHCFDINYFELPTTLKYLTLGMTSLSFTSKNGIPKPLFVTLEYLALNNVKIKDENDEYLDTVNFNFFNAPRLKGAIIIAVSNVFDVNEVPKDLENLYLSQATLFVSKNRIVSGENNITELVLKDIRNQQEISHFLLRCKKLKKLVITTQHQRNLPLNLQYISPTVQQIALKNVEFTGEGSLQQKLEKLVLVSRNENQIGIIISKITRFDTLVIELLDENQFSKLDIFTSKANHLYIGKFVYTEHYGDQFSLYKYGITEHSLFYAFNVGKGHPITEKDFFNTQNIVHFNEFTNTAKAFAEIG